MAFRLRTIDTTADGRKIVRNRDVDKAVVTIGRSSENDIHLPDLAVDPIHARMEILGNRINVQAMGTLGFGVDGVSSENASVDPTRGAELRFGTYNLTVSRDEDGTPLVTIAQVASHDAGQANDEKQRFALSSAMPGKRKMSWILGILILLIFLGFPVVSNLYHQVSPAASVHGDKSWTAGPLSTAHHQLEGKCEACHVKPFESVRDGACLSCHKDVHDHAPPARLAMARGEGPLAEQLLWAVARTFGKEGPGSCADCHREHEGQNSAVAAPRQQFCADCHVGLKDRLTDTALPDAGDFGALHPQFSVGIVTDPFMRKVSQVSLDANPRENNGLTFPHKLHLDPLGGVARMAATIGRDKGYGRAGLQCDNCHHATEDGVRFKPVSMERDCEACHNLSYDKVGDTVRTLHHGDVNQMIADLSVSGYRPSAAPERQRPGQYAPGGNYYADFAPHYTSAATFQQALSKKGVCGECHTPVMRGGKPGVMPVTQVTRFMPNGWFDHKAHAQQKCTECHAADQSRTSADVLLPKVAECRTCHLGEDSHEAKVPSSCVMCHGYHPTQNAPRGGTKRDRL